MPETLLEAFHKTSEAFQAAIGSEDREEIGSLDRQIQYLFDQILQVEPDTSTSRTHLISFLLDHCCNNSGRDGLVQAAKNRILELL